MVDWCDGRVAELSHWEGMGQSEEFAMIGRHVFPVLLVRARKGESQLSKSGVRMQKGRGRDKRISHVRACWRRSVIGEDRKLHQVQACDDQLCRLPISQMAGARQDESQFPRV
jgi:hypothetical protein